MKKIFALVLFTCFSTSMNASTNITTAMVSGHWTAAGSPYLVDTIITVPIGSSLTIDPGVDVIFQGPYGLSVMGVLHASGTAASPINFTIQDTTGWYIDTSNAGGWEGLGFGYYVSSVPDSSVLNYCTFKYLKNFCISCVRSLHIQHCDFANNKYCPAAMTGGSGLINLYTRDTSVHIEVSDCNFYNNNSSTYPLIFVNNNDLGKAYLHNNSIHDNIVSRTASVFTGIKSILTFDYNTVYNNGDSATGGAEGIIDVSGDWAFFTGNKVYGNVCQYRAPFYLTQGIVELNGNYICNNRSLFTGSCGYAYGGGALFLEGTGFDTSTTNFAVINNVIANNFSPYLGGGIYVVGAKVQISNNDIINNKAPQGSGIYFDFPSTVTIKNNIFFGNEDVGLTSALSDDIYLRNNYTAPIDLRYDHNWSVHPFYLGFRYLVGSVIYHVGDTTTDITGVDPGLIAPTTTANVTESALTANFNINGSSACIDAGDTAYILTSPFDYAGDHRISGSNIDIGAYEYGASAFPLYTYPFAVENRLVVYPNPASDLVFVNTPQITGTIVFQDVTGKTIAERTVANSLTSFDIHSIPRGVYFAVWYDGNGTKTTQKFIVE